MKSISNAVPSWQPKKLKIIIALGNPEEKYANTYHNVGFLAVHFLEKKINPKTKLIFSETSMNLSGNFVKKTLVYFKNKPEQLVIAHDDADLLVGSYKLSFDKNSGGHKGVESVIKSLKTKKFWRLRLGIREPNEKKRKKAEDFVLNEINPSHKRILNKMFGEITEKFID